MTIAYSAPIRLCKVGKIYVHLLCKFNIAHYIITDVCFEICKGHAQGSEIHVYNRVTKKKKTNKVLCACAGICIPLYDSCSARPYAKTMKRL